MNPKYDLTNTPIIAARFISGEICQLDTSINVTGTEKKKQEKN